MVLNVKSSFLARLFNRGTRNIGPHTRATPTSAPEVYRFRRSGWVPNNEDLPVLLYRQGIDVGTRKRRSLAIEEVFKQNGWQPQWRGDIYTFDHYHSTVHEVLGIAIGWARLRLGGEGGQELVVRAGDVIALPAGTGHIKLESSRGFLVVAAYPPHTDWDICQTAPTAEMLENIHAAWFPTSDPVEGANGSLVKLWARQPKKLVAVAPARAAS